MNRDKNREKSLNLKRAWRVHEKEKKISGALHRVNQEKIKADRLQLARCCPVRMAELLGGDYMEKVVEGEKRVHGKLCFLFSKAVCWKCKKTIDIVAIGARVTCQKACIPDAPGYQGPHFAFFCFTEKLPMPIITEVKKRLPSFKLCHSKSKECNYWVNTCPHCQMIQGDWFMFFEPGEGFWHPEGASPVRFEETDIELKGERILADCVDPQPLVSL